MRPAPLAGLLLAGLAIASPAVASSSRPDLAEVHVAKPPIKVVAGGKAFRVRDTVRNVGKARSRATRSGYFLAAKPKRRAGRVRVGSRSVHALKPRKRSNGSVAARVGKGVRPGLYYLVACADAGHKVREAKEKNNCRAARKRIQVLAPSQLPPGCVPSAGSVEGIDVSAYQATIDFSQVAGAGVKFVYARSDAALMTDSTYATDDSHAKAAGLDFGAYQFFDPGLDPTTQANKFLADAAFTSGDLRPAIDVEISGGQTPETIASRVATWLHIVQAATGVQPLIYTAKFFWDPDVGDSGLAAQGFPLWVGSYTATPVLPEEWPDQTLWQYTSSGTVPGISGQTDLDHFNGGDLCAITSP